MQLPLVQYSVISLSHFQQPPNGGSLSAMSSDEDEHRGESSGGDTDSTYAKSLPTTADQVKVPVVRQAKSLPTTADQVKVDDVYFGEASACHLKCTDGQDSTQRENFRKVQHHSRIGKCPGCGTDSNLNTGSHCIVTIASQEWIALVATCGSCNNKAPKCSRCSPNKTPSPTGSCFGGDLLMYILGSADVSTAGDTASDTASDTTSGTASGTACDTASGTASDTTSGTASDTACDTASDTTSGTASGTACDTASGTACDTASGTASGTPSGTHHAKLKLSTRCIRPFYTCCTRVCTCCAYIDV